MRRAADALLVALQSYFFLMNVTVERCYCHHTVQECVAQGSFLAEETLDFTKSFNPLFLARPEWIRVATCISAYGFPAFYLLIAFAAAFDQWPRFRLPITIFVGMKLNALLFYHTMEFLSATPPPNPVPYFGVEGPYLVSIALVCWRMSCSAADGVKPKSA